MKTKYIYLLSALTLGFVSCQQGGQNADIMPGGAMSFKIIAPNANTRVANGAFEADDQIGLYVTDYIKDQTSAPLQISGNRANNVAMTYDGVKWMTERAVYWGESKADVYAYYPYMADIADVDEQPFAVATDQSVGGAYELSDLLWAKAAGVAQSDGAVQLEMKHAMSRLVVKIVAGEDYVGSLPKDATVHLHSTVTDALVSLVNGSVVKNPYGGANSIKMRNLGIHSFAEGDAVVYEAIVVPQMLETSVPLLEINSKSVSYLLEDMFNFKPGVSYTYTAVLNTSTTAIKIDIGCTTDDWNNMGGGSGDSGDSEGGAGTGGVDISSYADLSAEGTANCYLIKTAGNYKFKAVMGNSNATVGNVKKAEVLWETFGTDVMPNEGDLIASVFYQDGYVCFSTPETFADGNASIAVRNSKGVILWSWHIWCAEEGWNDHIYANNAGIMMDRNLGATSATPGDVGALGLLYQWGRKDPFLGSCAKSGTTLAASTGSWSAVSGSKSASYAEENPTTFVSSYYDWCSQNGEDYAFRWQENKKSLYDPCPVGYRVPNGGNDGFWATANVKSSGDYTNRGMYWTLADGETTAWYPAVGYRFCSGGSLGAVGDNGYCWSASPSNSSTAYILHFDYNGNIYLANGAERAYGRSVRCVKE